MNFLTITFLQLFWAYGVIVYERYEPNLFTLFFSIQFVVVDVFHASPWVEEPTNEENAFLYELGSLGLQKA